MTKTRSIALAIIAVGLLSAVPATAQTSFFTRLFARFEVPALSTFANGTFTAELDEDRTALVYELHYTQTDGNVTQSHIHFAQPGVNGGIMTFLCSNLGNGPVGTQPCPTTGGTITGTIEADDIVASAAAQGIPAGNMFEFTRALLQNVTYVNVHTDLFPGGELRGNIVRNTAAAAAEIPIE
jgi:hypothetical protein